MTDRHDSRHEHFIRLLRGFINQTLSPDELEEFLLLLPETDSQEALTETVQNDLESRSFAGMTTRAQMESARRALLEKTHAARHRRWTIPGPLWLRWTAAAAIVVITGAAIVLVNREKVATQAMAQKPANGNTKVVPGSTQAMLTLSDGSIIVLDSSKNGSLAQQGKTKVTKLTGDRIAYDATDSSEVRFNTLSVPRGCKTVNLQLADGSIVVLNSGSSITFPTAFTGKDRKVELTGEAYFDITRDTHQPFIVKKGNSEVTVLGTHFNVNAYDDEATIDVTLLEGSIKVAKGNAERLLKPGEQARISSGIAIVNDVDIDEVVAWKNGRFQFDGTGIEEVMRQIARWYGVDVVYEGSAKKQHFTGGISREVEVSEVFKMLETTGAVHFKLEGRKVVVTL